MAGRKPAFAGDSWNFDLIAPQVDGVFLSISSPGLTITASVTLNDAPWGGPFTPTYLADLNRWRLQLDLPGPGSVGVRWLITYGLLQKTYEESIFVETRKPPVSVAGQTNLDWDVGPQGIQGIQGVPGETGATGPTVQTKSTGLVLPFNTTVLDLDSAFFTLSELPAGEANISHIVAAHDGRYYTESEIAAFLATYQPLDDTLSTLASLVTVADRMIYFTGVDTAALATLVANARTFLGGGDLKIKKTTPNIVLDTNGAAQQAEYWLYDNGTAKWAIYKDTNNKLAFYNSQLGRIEFTLDPATGDWTITDLAGTAARVVEASSAGLLSATSRLGLVQLGDPVSFSASSGVNFDSVFTSAFDHYQVWIEIDSMSAAANSPLFRFRVGGANDAGATDYAYGVIAVNSAGTVTGTGSTGTTFALAYNGVVAGTLTDIGIVLDIMQPLSASARSRIAGHGFGLRSGVDWAFQGIGGSFGTDKSHTGFALIPSGGTMTGKATLYGLRI